MAKEREVKERLRAVLAAPVTTAAEARRHEEAAGKLREILEAEQRAAQLFAGEAKAGYSTRSSLAGLTLHEAARRVLEQAGRPLHAKVIGDLMKAGGWRHPRATHARPDLVVHQLAARLPSYAAFERVAPQTFALTEWRETKEPVPPLIGVFDGPGGPVGRRIGESREAAGASTWRSS
jgi:hypothetical protein